LGPGNATGGSVSISRFSGARGAPVLGCWKRLITGAGIARVDDAAGARCGTAGAGVRAAIVCAAVGAPQPHSAYCGSGGGQQPAMASATAVVATRETSTCDRFPESARCSMNLARDAG
jgi:hypothetical protein